jgi:hypothetical protein
MKRLLILISVLILIAALASVLVVRSRAPEWLRVKIISSLTDSCPLCKAELGSVEVSFFGGRLVLHDFEFVDTPEHSTQVAVKAHLIEIEFDPTAYLKKLILINHMKGEGIHFTLTENPKINSPPENTPALSGLPPMVIKETVVSESSFRYVHKIVPHESSLLLTKIHGSLGSWVTRPDLVEKYAPRRTSMLAKGELEHSGSFEVKAEIDALSKKGTFKLDVDVKDQNLMAVSDFFHLESGMVLQGLVIDVSTKLDMENGQIDGVLKATYTDLKIKIEDRKNSGVKNFLETVGADIVIAGAKGVNGKPPGEKIFHDERTADQSLFKALFHALGRAATAAVK